MQGALSLCTGSVGKHHATVHVTDGINTGHVSHHVVVHLDAATAHGNANSVQTLRQHGLTSYRHEHLLAGHALGLALELIGNGITVLALGDAVDGSAGDDFYAALAQDGLQALGHVLVERGQDFLAVLDDGHLDTKRAEYGGKLHADDATTHDAQALGQRLHCQDVVTGHGQVSALDGKAAGSRSGSDDDVLGLVFLAVDNNGVGVLENGLALDGSDAGSTHEHFHAFAQLLHDSLFALKHGSIVKSHLTGLHAPLFGLAHQVDDLGVAAQGLSGNATAVQASAAHLVTLDDGNGQAVCSSIGSGLITARTSTNDNNVKHSH